MTGAPDPHALGEQFLPAGIHLPVIALIGILAALALAGADLVADNAAAHNPFRQCAAEMDAWRRASAASGRADDASSRALDSAAEYLAVFGNKAAGKTPTFAIRVNAAVKAQAKARRKQDDRIRAEGAMMACFKRWQDRRR